MENNPSAENATPLPSLHPQMWAPPPHQHFIPFPTYAIGPREMPWVMPHNFQEMPVHHWIPPQEQYAFPVPTHPNPEHPAPDHPPPQYRHEGYFFPYFPPQVYDHAVQLPQEPPHADLTKPKRVPSPPQPPKKQPARPREPISSAPSHRRGPGVKIDKSPNLSVEVLHKPRGSQGVWKPIEEKQRLRVTLGRGKNLRVLVRPRVPVDWASLQVGLVERVDESSDLWDDCPSSNNFSLESRQSVDEDDDTGARWKSMQLEVKLYAIHKNVAFKAQLKTIQTNEVLTAVSYDMLTHNSGRRDAEVKRKQMEATGLPDGDGTPTEAKRPRRASTMSRLTEADDDDEFVPDGGVSIPTGRSSSSRKALRDIVGGDDDEDDEDFVLDNIKNFASNKRRGTPSTSSSSSSPAHQQPTAASLAPPHAHPHPPAGMTAAAYGMPPHLPLQQQQASPPPPSSMGMGVGMGRGMGMQGMVHPLPSQFRQSTAPSSSSTVMMQGCSNNGQQLRQQHLLQQQQHQALHPNTSLPQEQSPNS